MEFVVAGCALVGALFVLIAAIGVLRMPDLLLRTAAATKASTFGLGLILLGAALGFASLETVSKAIAIIGFVALTAPIAAHMISRAAYLDKVRLWEKTVINELGDPGEPPRTGPPGDSPPPPSG
jgi:multicomponent Na+:H+ antiporter subunit G